jgi:UDP-N-acetylglucosamine/UDP-N-acetylgalactosamine diphosphorylase
VNTELLTSRGVQILCPASVYIDAGIAPERIAHQGVCIHPGCRLIGRDTFISDDVKIGTEGPVTINNCQIGRGVELKSGYFENAVFLEGARLGAGSHVRGGTILEEQASTAHCVGLKQTILFPFVTLGSLINFCDCLMAGGTSRKNHSEVGSSFIHFNYTPDQDKATASLFGDVPRGVMLNQRPIFLGGQGGVVGPCQIAYGTVSAAGTIVRRDQEKPDCLIIGGTGKGGVIPWKPIRSQASPRIIRNNLIFIGNLFALRAWYNQVRRGFVGRHFPAELLAGLVRTSETAINERLKHLRLYFERQTKQPNLMKAWETLEAIGESVGAEKGDKEIGEAFLKKLEAVRTLGRSYIETMQALSPETTDLGTRWLESIVNTVVASGSRLNTHATDGR